jgi:hypothetical protein
MKIKSITTLFALFLVVINVFGQDFCRNVAGKKICYTVSETKMLVRTDKLDANDIKNALQNTVAGSLRNIESRSSDGMLFMVEMEHTSKENLLELIHQWSFREDVLSVSPVFVDEQGTEVGGYTNEIFVRLKSKDDYPILQKSAEAYSIKDIEPSEFDELRYKLTLPRNTQKNALDIANELQETGSFELAVPKLTGSYAELGNSNKWIDRRELRTSSSSFTVYPNPADDVLYIDIDRQAMDNPACKFYIYNLQGSKALQTTTNGNRVKINVSVIPNGIYVLRLYDILSSKQETKKIVVKH